MLSDRAHGLCIEVGRVVKAGAPDGWQEVEVHRCQLGTFGTTVITYQMAEGSQQTREVEGLDDLFLQLKAAEYNPGEGTWYVCQLDYSPRGKSYNARLQTLGQESPFAEDVEVPAAAYVEELTMFPRRPALTPPWMTAAWPEGVPLPEAGSTTASPVDGKSGPARPPLGTMVVRTVGRDDDPELIVLGMAEHEDGTGNALIFMMSTEELDEQEAGSDMDTYCIVREEQAGTTYGGVTRCEIASSRLTLHFTEEAAKELHVEPIVRADLQITHESVELLRSSLRKILLSGRHDQHPHRMHL
jgi:hypothetical protein